MIKTKTIFLNLIVSKSCILNKLYPITVQFISNPIKGHSKNECFNLNILILVPFHRVPFSCL